MMSMDGGQGLDEWKGGMGSVDDTSGPVAVLALVLLGLAMGLH